MKKVLLLLPLVLFLVSCSGSKPKQDVSDETAGLELVDAENLEGGDLLVEDVALTDPAFPAEGGGGEGDLFLEDPLAAPADGGLALDEPMMEAPTEPTMDPMMDQGMAMAEEPMMEQPTEPMMEAAPAPSQPVINEQAAARYYTVEPNDTLMLVAFKLFGDYGMWRKLQDWNQTSINNPTNLTVGSQLVYYSDSDRFSWNPQGEPWLIKKNDTLSYISNSVYGTWNKWRKIWDNNRPLIKDPDKIFVGFTIYYIPEDGRGVASP